MVSERKRAANRANASKSTGPRTVRGKEKSSRNALKHGLLSQRTPVLPFEDEFEYRTLADAMMRDFAPAGVVQREVVTRIVQINWKMRRIPAIEAALLEHAFRDISDEFEHGKENGDYDEDAVIEPATAAKVIATQFAVNGDRPYERLEIYGMRLQRSFISACRELAKLKKETQGEELPILNQLLYLKEDTLRMERKMEQMDSAEETLARDRGEVGVTAEPRDTVQQGATQVNEPNEPTAEGKSRLGQTLPRSKASASAIARAVDATLNGGRAPKDWPRDKVWPYKVDFRGS
jgi:hypothetical protein